MAEALVVVESNTTGTGRLFAERAIDQGLSVHLLSQDPARYPYLAELGVQVHRCPTDSDAAVVAACRDLAATGQVVGVTSSSEYFIGAAAAAARALGLPGPDPAVLLAARDKGTQRSRFAAAQVSSPAFRVVTTPAAAAQATAELGAPVVLKPVSRSGSLGVQRCDDPFAAARHAGVLLATTHDERGRQLPSRLLVEEYLAGPEFSVELVDGQVRAVVGKQLDERRGFLETGHDVPALLPAETTSALGRTAQAAVAALGLTWGAAHVELRLVAGEPVVIEVNPRLAGGMIPAVLQAATGEDLIAELIALTTGRTPPRRPAGTGCASIRFVVPDQDGVVAHVAAPDRALAEPGVVAAVVTARPGQSVTRQGCFLDRLGYAIAIGADQAQAGRRAARAAALLMPRITPVPAPVGRAAQL